MSTNELVAASFGHRGINATTTAVLAYLASQADQNDEFQVSLQGIADATRLSVACVSTNITKLRKAEFIIRGPLKLDEATGARARVYQLNREKMLTGARMSG